MGCPPPYTSHHTTLTSTTSDVFVVVVDPVPVSSSLSFTPFAEFFVYDNGVNPSDAKKGGEIRKELACCTYVRVAPSSPPPPVPAVMCAPHNSPSVLASRMPGYLCVCVFHGRWRVCCGELLLLARVALAERVFLTLCIAVGGGRRPTCLALGVPAR